MVLDNKIRLIRDKLEDIIDDISTIDTENAFNPTREIKNKDQKHALSIVSRTFKQWFGDLSPYKPERVYSPKKSLDDSPTSGTRHPLSDILPFTFAESLYTDAEEELFKDYKTTAPAYIPSARAKIFYGRNGGSPKSVAEVDSSFMKVDEEFILHSQKEDLKRVLLAAAYLHFLCDQLDFDRGLSG